MTRLLRRFLRPYAGLLAGVLVLQSCQAIASLVLPTLNADVIDRGVLRADTAVIWRLGGLMVGVTAVQMVLSIGAVWFGSRAAMAFGRDVRASLFHRVTSFSSKEVNLYGAPSLITRITNDVQQVQMLVMMACTMLVMSPVTIVGGVLMAVRQNVGLSWLLAISLPLLTAGLGFVVVKTLPQFTAMQERIDAINDILREQIIGMRVVRAFVREPLERERFGQRNAALTQTSLTAARWMALMFPVMHIVMNGSSVAVVWFGGLRISDGRMTIGSLVAFLTYFSLILTAVMMGNFVAMMIPRAAVSGQRIAEVLDTEASVRPPDSPVRSLTSHGTLELRGVGFHYPGAESPVLSDVSFRSLPGQTTAVVGSTGAGKTTLINLVARLFDVTSGVVLMDGVDVRRLDPELLWNRIGLVPQKPYLFSGTIASNLLYGKPDASEDEMWEALRVAQADGFVQAMGGLEAEVAQGGLNVSGGQRQRLAMARALVRKPEIYLFDDSFSALDVATDARVRAALRPYTADATVLVVAQRVSTIVSAHQILVLEDGRVIDVGRHDELLVRCPTYAEIVESQVGKREVVA